MLTAVSMFVFASPVFADSPSFSVVNNILNLSLNPGQSKTSVVSVVNESSSVPADLEVEVVGLGQGTDGSTIALAASQDTSPYSARTFTNIDTTSMDLQPNASQNINVNVSVPANINTGEYYAGIYIYTQASNQGNVGQILASIVPIILTVPGFTLVNTGKITQATATQATTGQTIEIDTTLENTGNCRISEATDTITLNGSNNNQISQYTVQLSAPSILPTFSRTLKAYFSSQSVGNYSATSVITTNNGTQLDSKTFDFAIAAASTATTGIKATQITSFAPTSGGSGASVTITGSNFTGTTAVQFGNTNAVSYIVNSDSTITAIVPDLGTSNLATAIIVQAPGGAAISNGNFSYTGSVSQSTTTPSTMPAPVISSFTPTSGASGTSITIIGSGFTGATGVQFGTGNSQPSFTVISDNEIIAVVPNLGTSNTMAAITVAAPGGTAISSGNFSYISSNSEQNNSSTIVTTFINQTQGQSNGISWAIVGIVIAPILIIGLIVFAIMGNRRRKESSGE